MKPTARQLACKHTHLSVGVGISGRLLNDTRCEDCGLTQREINRLEQQARTDRLRAKRDAERAAAAAQREDRRDIPIAPTEYPVLDLRTQPERVRDGLASLEPHEIDALRRNRKASI